MGISLSGASQRGIQTGRDRQDLKGSQESLALLVLWGPEERKESEESQAKLDPPDSKDSQGRDRARRPYGRDAYCGNWKGYHRRDRPGNSL